MFALLGGKLKAFLLGGIGVLAVIATALYGLLQREKKERVSQELEDEKASNEQHDKAVEAMLRGVENEHKKESDNRKYDFTD